MIAAEMGAGEEAQADKKNMDRKADTNKYFIRLISS